MNAEIEQISISAFLRALLLISKAYLVCEIYIHTKIPHYYANRCISTPPDSKVFLPYFVHSNLLFF